MHDLSFEKNKKFPGSTTASETHVRFSNRQGFRWMVYVSYLPQSLSAMRLASVISTKTLLARATWKARPDGKRKGRMNKRQGQHHYASAVLSRASKESDGLPHQRSGQAERRLRITALAVTLLGKRTKSRQVNGGR